MVTQVSSNQLDCQFILYIWCSCSLRCFRLLVQLLSFVFVRVVLGSHIFCCLYSLSPFKYSLQLGASSSFAIWLHPVTCATSIPVLAVFRSFLTLSCREMLSAQIFFSCIYNCWRCWRYTATQIDKGFRPSPWVAIHPLFNSTFLMEFGIEPERPL